MGFLSSLGKIAGVVAAPFTGGASLLATLGSTALDIGSTLYANNQQKKAATVAYDRSMEASNTSYQRGVEDMRLAGLNPALAYSQGGASTPTSAKADVATMPPLGSSALSNLATRAQMAQTIASTQNTSAQTLNTNAATEHQRLINEGLRTIPPAFRAAAASGSDIGSAAAAATRFGASAARGAGAAARGASKFLDRFRGRGYDMYKGFSNSIKKRLSK